MFDYEDALKFTTDINKLVNIIISQNQIARLYNKALIKR